MNRHSPKSLLCYLLIAIVGVGYLVTLRDGHTWEDDFAGYVLHARNIATGQGYAETGYIYNGEVAGVGPVAYPPVFPLLLAPVYSAFGLNLTAMKVVVVMFFVGFLVVVHLNTRRQISNTASLLLIGALGLSPYFWYLKDHIISDIPFAFLCFGTLLFVDRAHVKHNRRLWYGVALGLLLYLCYGTRSVGIALLPMLCAFDLLRFRRVTLATMTALVVCVVGMVGQATLISGPSGPDHYAGQFETEPAIALSRTGGYSDQFEIDPQILLDNHVNYIRAVAWFLDNGYSRALRFLLAGIVFILAGVGYVLRVRRTIGILEVFPLFYMMPVLVWPAFQGVRLLIPVIPLLIFYALYAMDHTSWLPIKLRRQIVVAAFAFLLGVSYLGAYVNVEEYRGEIPDSVLSPETQEMFSFVRHNTADDATFICSRPRGFALFTERSASVYHDTPTDDELWEYFARIGAEYVIQSAGDDTDYFTHFLDRNRLSFSQAFANQRFIVLKIARPGGSIDLGGSL